MNSKIIIYIPGSWYELGKAQKCFKKISELGFENIIIDAKFILKEIEFVKLITSEKLSLWGVSSEESLSAQEMRDLVVIMHQLDCGYFISNCNQDLNTITDSGIKLLEQRNHLFYKRGFDVSELPVLHLNALSFVEKPLQSKLINEIPDETEQINRNRENNIYYLIQADLKLPEGLYLKHCKDILNRFFFLGVR